MPDKRTHRGPHPEDAKFFAEETWPRLRTATADLSWLLTRGYAGESALKLVGDRYDLARRQRIAVMRSASSDQSLESRRERKAELAELAGQPLEIDGYNLLITVEAALAGGVILRGRDGCYRDLASVHGTFRRVEETFPAIELIGRFLAGLGVGPCVWRLDSPVSNSGRLKGYLLEIAEKYGWDWSVELAANPDQLLIASPEIVATADSVILDRCRRWANLTVPLVDKHIPGVQIVDLRA
ncbi:MAG TPA: DUF434 domain-containing protein [Pirellulales bacterium]|nr:DUF434 domain-containing protein [Pirellulales bacterium]